MRSSSISDRIDRLGLDTAEPVAISIANPSYYLATIFALFRCGFSVAPVNPRLYPHLRSAGVRNLIYDTHGQVLSGGRNVRFDMSWLPVRRPTASRSAVLRSSGRRRRHDLLHLGNDRTYQRRLCGQWSGLSARYSSPLTWPTATIARH